MRYPVLNPYAGPPAFPTEPHELTPEEWEDEVVSARLMDAEGQDTAYDMGLSERFLPAPKGGRVDATREELLP